jgi:hypothetical protein
VSGCRCAACRASNTAYYHERQKRGKELAAQIKGPDGPTPQIWTAPDGSKRERWYHRACPGPGDGVPCPKESHLRKDSKGGVCRVCRELLVWNGDVDAAPARAHLHRLSRAGVGYKSVAAACDVGHTTIAKILSGKKHAIRRSTSLRILSVTKDAAADHGVIDARKTWRLILDMRLLGGLTRGEIAQRLGRQRAALQLGRQKVLARTAFEVRRLHTEVMREVALEFALPEICPDCGFSHAPEDRRAFIRRMLPCSAEELREAAPSSCWWSDGRTLYRDLKALGTERINSEWQLVKREAA